LDAFFALASELGIGKVELRNDLPGVGIVDKLTPGAVRALAQKSSIEIVTINALQKFNLPAFRARCARELGQLAKLAREIGCGAIVFCPNNDTGDTRSSQEMFRDTLESLVAFAPILEENGIIGLVEPLGFAECSLRSKATAIEAIVESKAKCYKIVHDTFHHAIGPDTIDVLEKSLDVSFIGLVHVSGVVADLPMSSYRDPQRVLITSRDRMENRQQLAILQARGYRGPVSFEPFAAEVQKLPRGELAGSIRASIETLNA
jgi:2-keto-myo-inositol isomerase